MGGKIGGDEEVIADINITPFVDVILVILIIFMITSSTTIKGLANELPAAKNADPSEGDSVGITLLASGELLVDGARADAEVLRARLRSARAESEDVVALVSAEKGVAWGRMVWVIDVLKEEGQAKYFFNTSKKDAIGPDPASVGEGRGQLPGD